MTLLIIEMWFALFRKGRHAFFLVFSGEHGLEQAAFKLADRLGRLERALREADLTMCYRHALNICGVSSQIGLVDVARVASDVLTCTREGNMEALSAVIGRLNRVAEASLFSVFELEA